MSDIWNASPHEIREAFLAYFRERSHEERPSAPLVPEDDPTLLFTGAGMNPFKDHFLGRVPLTYRRATTSQKCLRTGDLENVGRTPGHHTFFEMLGNFSFGDYFKKEAIEWAWEFLTVNMSIPPALLRVSVYEEDDEAADHWTRVAGIPADRIARLGAKANYWPANAPEAGPNGPCGPCTEIFFDLGEGVSFGDCTVEGCPEVPAAVDCDCRRFVEIWNLVFQQYDRKGVNELEPLEMQNIDTGMGFERLMLVLAHLRTGSPDLPAGERVIWNFQT
ncbi:MAG: alanine--tRNA ligase-related protein, partial [Planctomycetota bacterium]